MGGMGLVLAALGAKRFGDVRTAIGLYCALTLVHLFCNYRSLKLVALDWLNGWRLHWVVGEFLDCLNGVMGDVDPSDFHVSNPAEASKKEPLLFLPESKPIDRQSSQYPILMGVSFNKMVQLTHRSPSSLQSNLTKGHGTRRNNYILAVGRVSKAKRCILVAFFSDSNNSEKAKAYLHGCLVRRALTSLLADCKGGHPNGGEMGLVQQAEEAAERKLVQIWPIFEKVVTDAGWKLDKTECSTEGYELHLM
mmetsp:Transcript_51963/g.110409  ORF Transcript_51963/g.110409 Transcript_51963/m.110409 type:complete len:250 (-) Transcript_51963:294-1043(-)